jgi:precorrin-4/cobalt-precorrin-4 C11-methyltransferase
MAVKVFFIGAGPGDPELLTVKARGVIERADVIVYADSLVNPEICGMAPRRCQIYRSAALNLEEISEIIVAAAREGKTVARLQSGDPSIYGAIREQMAVLDKEGIAYEVIPGVSSLFAAAAALKAEFTVPDVSQTLIVTRLEGKTPVPAGESLRSLASHRATIAIFLSAGMAARVAEELEAGGYRPDTPAAVVYRASWPEEMIMRTTLKNLAADVKAAGITKQALLLIGSFLNPGMAAQRSRLYDRDFSHEYRSK